MTNSLLTLAAIATTTIAATTASAAHSSFCFTGDRCGFDGEVHLINSLVLMEDAYVSRCHVTRSRLVSRARLEIMYGIRESCDYAAKRELLDAYRALTRFLVTGDRCYLDSAAASVTTAIEFSQVAYLGAHETPVLHNPHHIPHVAVHTPVVRTHRTHRVHTHRRHPSHAIRIGKPHSGFSLRNRILVRVDRLDHRVAGLDAR